MRDEMFRGRKSFGRSARKSCRCRPCICSTAVVVVPAEHAVGPETYCTLVVVPALLPLKSHSAGSSVRNLTKETGLHGINDRLQRVWPVWRMSAHFHYRTREDGLPVLPVHPMDHP
jgi:hypothetical protein